MKHDPPSHVPQRAVVDVGQLGRREAVLSEAQRAAVRERQLPPENRPLKPTPAHIGRFTDCRDIMDR